MCVAKSFRWLQATEDFYEDTGGLRLNGARVTKLADKPRADQIWPRGYFVCSG